MLEQYLRPVVAVATTLSSSILPFASFNRKVVYRGDTSDMWTITLCGMAEDKIEKIEAKSNQLNLNSEKNRQ